MKTLKTFLIILGVIIIAGGIFLAVSQQQADQPQEKAATSTTDWQTYESAEYNFSIQYPPGWEVATSSPDRPTGPLISIYQPKKITGEPPFTHHSEETHVSVYPQGIPTEGFLGQYTTTNVDFSVSTNQVHDYVLADGTDFATYANVGEVAAGWNQSGFVFAHVAIDNFETECRRDGEVIPDPQCDVLTGDTLVRFGDIDEDIRELQMQILESFISM